MSALSKIKNLGELALGFAQRSGMPVHIFEQPSEEILHDLTHKKPVKLYAPGGRMISSSGAKARLEENYLFDTRCFPASAIAAGDYSFFQNAVGQPAINNGFPVGTVIMTELETNMDVAGQIAQGKNFVFTSVGVSFNTDIATVDAGLLLEAAALRFEKQGGQYSLRHGPLSFWPGGTGLSGYSATTVAATTIQGTHNGDADIRATRKLAIPRVIREKESFAYKMIIPRAFLNKTGSGTITPSAPCLVRVWLWGGQQDTIPV